MKTWKQIIESTLNQKSVRGWDKLYWSIDLHDSVITGKYNKFNQGSEVYPYAKETLDFLYKSDIHKTVLWTSSYPESAFNVCSRFGLNFHYFNENPECPSGDLCDFSKKFYFNFLIDDKSGFDAHKDWEEIYRTLTNKTDI